MAKYPDTIAHDQDAVPYVDRVLATDDDVEQFAIGVDDCLRAQGQDPCDDGVILLLMEAGFTAEGAASVIIAGRYNP